MLSCLILPINHVHPQVSELMDTPEPTHLIQKHISNKILVTFNKQLSKFTMHWFGVYCLPLIIIRRTQSGRIFLFSEPYVHRLYGLDAEKHHRAADERLSSITNVLHQYKILWALEQRQEFEEVKVTQKVDYERRASSNCQWTMVGLSQVWHSQSPDRL